MLSEHMTKNIEGAYELYRKTFINNVKDSDGFGKGIESVCNHKEMAAIFEAIPQPILDRGTWIDWVLEQMLERVGQMGTKRTFDDKKWPSFAELEAKRI